MKNNITILLLLLLPFVTNAFADDEKTFNQLKSKIQKHENELKSLESNKASLAQQISVIERNHADIRHATAIISRQISENNQRLIELKKQEFALTEKSKQYKTQAYRGLIFYMDNSNALIARTVLTNADSANNIAVIEILSKVNIGLTEKIKQYAATLSSITSIRSDMIALNTKLENDRKSNEELAEDKRKSSATLSKKLASVQRDAFEQKEYINKLKSDQAALDSVLRERKIKMSASAFAKSKGNLIRPISGSIIEPFGERVIGETGVKVMHKGIRIQPFSSSDVRAVFDGKVVYVNNLTGVGNIVIVQHDETYYSIYANLDEFYVTTMQTIEKNNVLGRIDVDLNVKSSYLYFEIRQHEQAVNPVPWLKKQ